jgi:hypothetical protein
METAMRLSPLLLKQHYLLQINEGSNLRMKLKQLYISCDSKADFQDWGEFKIYLFFTADVKVAPTWQVLTESCLPA